MAAIQFQFFQKFLNGLAQKKFDFTSDSTCTVKAVLVAAANAPSLSVDDGLSDLTTVSLTNLSGGDNTITGITASETSGVLDLTATDKTLAASGGDIGPFRYVCLYDDDSSGDLLIGMLDYGANFTINDGAEFVLKFSYDGGKFATLSLA